MAKLQSEARRITGRRARKASRQWARDLDRAVNAMTTEQYIRLLDIADPNPMSDAERAEFDKMSDGDLLAELGK